MPLIDSSDFDTANQARSARKRQRRTGQLLLVASLICFVGLLAILRGPGLYARWTYTPMNGDIIFQSLKPAPLVIAIEGVTKSQFSHCGIVIQNGNKFFVCEAFDSVELTPLGEFLCRGRSEGFAVYRPKHPFQQKSSELTDAVQT